MVLMVFLDRKHPDQKLTFFEPISVVLSILGPSPDFVTLLEALNILPNKKIIYLEEEAYW